MGALTRVAIIGGGIGGLTAANALLRAGVEVSVCEAAGELTESRRRGRAARQRDACAAGLSASRDAVRKVAGRTEYAVTRDGITGRCHLQDKPGAAGGSAGHRARDRAPGRTCSTCSPRRCPRDRVAWEAVRLHATSPSALAE